MERDHGAELSRKLPTRSCQSSPSLLLLLSSLHTIMLSVNKTMKSRDEGVGGGAGGEGVDGCPVLKLIAAFVQQDFQIEAFDNKEPDRSLAPSLPALTRRASQGFVEELLSPENRMGGGSRT